MIVLSDEFSIVNHRLRELRDKTLQKDQQRFEHNLELMGMIAGYELSKQLIYADHTTKTPLGTINTPLLKDKLVLGTVLRAGLPLQSGLRKIFGTTELAFVGAGRKPETSSTVEIDLSYVVSPDLAGKVLILADTMLATGKSLIKAYEALVNKHGAPLHTFVVAVIASQAGIDYLSNRLPSAELIIGAVDPELNDKFYIVPGLGDAGDLLYGSKL